MNATRPIVLAVAGWAFACSGAAQVPAGLFQVNTYLPGRQSHPAVASDDQGAFVVAWQSDMAEDGSGLGIFARLFAADGQPLAGPFGVNTHTTGNQARPSVARSPDGTFIVIWDSDGAQDGDGKGIFAQRFDADGAPLASETRLNVFTTGDQLRPAIPSRKRYELRDSAHQPHQCLGAAAARRSERRLRRDRFWAIRR